MNFLAIVLLCATVWGQSVCAAQENEGILGTAESSTIKEKAATHALIEVISDLRLQHTNPLLIDKSIDLLGVYRDPAAIPALFNLVPYEGGRAPVEPGIAGHVPFPRIAGAADRFEQSPVIVALILIGRENVNPVLDYFARPNLDYKNKMDVFIMVLKGILGDDGGLMKLRQYRNAINNKALIERFDACIAAYSKIKLDASVMKKVSELSTSETARHEQTP